MKITKQDRLISRLISKHRIDEYSELDEVEDGTAM